jgi:hypothetical protein
MSATLPNDVPREYAPPETEPAFLPHPLMDQLLQTVIALGAELWIERDRRMALEAVLIERGIIDADTIENHRPGEDEKQARAAARSALVDRTLGGLKDIPAGEKAGD